MGVYTLAPLPGFLSDLGRILKKYPRVAEDVATFFKNVLTANPRCGDPIPGAGMCRKVRCGIPSANISKRDGLRIVYLTNVQEEAVLPLFMYLKSERPNVLANEILRAVEKITPHMKQEAIRTGRTAESIDEQFRELLRKRDY